MEGVQGIVCAACVARLPFLHQFAQADLQACSSCDGGGASFQPWVACLTCTDGADDGRGVCLACAALCHAGHVLTKPRIMEFEASTAVTHVCSVVTRAPCAAGVRSPTAHATPTHTPTHTTHPLQCDCGTAAFGTRQAPCRATRRAGEGSGAEDAVGAEATAAPAASAEAAGIAEAVELSSVASPLPPPQQPQPPASGALTPTAKRPPMGVPRWCAARGGATAGTAASIPHMAEASIFLTDDSDLCAALCDCDDCMRVYATSSNFAAIMLQSASDGAAGHAHPEGSSSTRPRAADFAAVPALLERLAESARARGAALAAAVGGPHATDAAAPGAAARGSGVGDDDDDLATAVSSALAHAQAAGFRTSEEVSRERVLQLKPEEQRVAAAAYGDLREVLFEMLRGRVAAAAARNEPVPVIGPADIAEAVAALTEQRRKRARAS